MKIFRLMLITYIICVISISSSAQQHIKVPIPPGDNNAEVKALEKQTADSHKLTADQKLVFLDLQNKLLTTQKAKSDLDMEFQAVQQQARTKYADLQRDEEKEKKEMENAIADLYKQTGLDPTRFDFDRTALEFRIKPAPPAAPAPPAPTK